MKSFFLAMLLCVGFIPAAFGSSSAWTLKHTAPGVYGMATSAKTTDGKVAILGVGCSIREHFAFLIVNWGEYIGQKGGGATLNVLFDGHRLENGPSYTFLVASQTDTLITGDNLIRFLQIMELSNHITISGTRNDNTKLSATWSLDGFTSVFHQLANACSSAST